MFRALYAVSGKLPPRKIAPWSGSGFGLGLALELGLEGGGGQFSSGAIFLEPFMLPSIFEKQNLFESYLIPSNSQLIQYYQQKK